jgi:RimJ/RimL family protein N-acetyltransferase
MTDGKSELRLDSLRAEDSDILFAWINNPELVKFNAPFAPVSREAHDRWFNEAGKRSNARIFAIRTDRLVGTVQLIDIHPVHRSAELTIRLAPESLGQGIGPKALGKLFEIARSELNLHRIWLRVFADNTRAIRAYENVGMTREGIMREAANIDGVWKDVIVMGIILDN